MNAEQSIAIAALIRVSEKFKELSIAEGDAPDITRAKYIGYRKAIEDLEFLFGE